MQRVVIAWFGEGVRIRLDVTGSASAERAPLDLAGDGGGIAACKDELGR